MAISQTINSATRKIPAWLLYFLGALPGLWLFWLAVQNKLGADPLAALEHTLGEYALQVLILGLLITPLRDLLNINLIKFRRATGLVAFFYVLSHLLVYLILDKQVYNWGAGGGAFPEPLWNWVAVIKDVTKRPYMIVGVLSFLILVPLAVTSNNISIRKLGPLRWRRIHWGVYVACILGATHFALLKKTWQFEPLMYVAIMVTLVGYRVWKRIR